MNDAEMQARYDILCVKSDRHEASETEIEERIVLSHALDPEMREVAQEQMQQYLDRPGGLISHLINK